MIFTDRKITIRNGKSTINEPVILYRGDYEVSIKFTIMESKFRFKSGVNLVDSEKASHGQLAILTPYGGNVFSEIVKCEDGTVTFTLTKEMIDQLEEVGLYSFQIRLFDYYRESRVSIPPVEFGIEVREPVASEDHDNEVNNAIVGYSIAKVIDGLNEDVPDTFDDEGNYNKTDWETGDRITEGKLNKIEDAIDKINQNEKKDVADLDKRVTNNYNVLSNELSTKVDHNDKISVNMIDKNQGKIDQTYLSDSLLQQIAGDAAVNAVPADNSITLEKLAFSTLTGTPINMANPKEFDIDKHLVNGRMFVVEAGYINTRFVTGYIPVMKGKRYWSSPYYTIALYDEEKNYLKDIETNSMITVNGFVRICGKIEHISEFMFNEGLELCEYLPYGEGALKTSSIKNRTIDRNKLSFPTLNIEPSYNLLDIKNTLFNKYIKPNGDLTTCADYWVNRLYVTDYIEVKSGTNYIINGRTYNVYGYDNNFTSVKFIDIIDNANGTTFVCPSDVIYVRATLYEEDKPIAMIYEGECVKPFVPYGEGILPKGIVKSENIEEGVVFKPSIISPNLFNKNTVKKGYFVQGWTGNVTPPIDGTTGWNASDWIEIEEGEVYSFTTMSNMAYYDKDKNYLTKGTDGGKVQVAPEGSKYLRISVYDDVLDTFQIVKGEILGEYTEYGVRYISKEQIHPSVFTEGKVFRYCIPDVVEVVEDETTEIFFDSILGVHNISNYYISLSGFNNININESNQRKMVITNPSANSSGIIKVYDNFNMLVLSIPLTIKVNPITNPSTPKNILVIGDSLTGQNSTTITELHRKITEYGLTNLNLIGTKNWGEGKNHEGRGGWKINDYLVDKEYNPFWSDTLGRSSFKEYCDRNGYSGIDYCIIHMNWNDNIKDPTHMYTQYKNIMTLISQDYPNCKIAAMSLTSYSSKNVSQLSRWCESTKFTAFDLADAYSKLHDENPNWYYINALSQIDVEYANAYTTAPVNIRSTETEKKLSDHVHFSNVGYLQIADAYFRKLMEFVNN